MRRLAAVALALAAALPACAQRGGGHAGFAARSGPGARSAPGFHGFGAPAYGPRRVPAPGLRYPARHPINRPSFYRSGTHRFFLRSYPYPIYGYSTGVILPYSGFYDDWFDNDADVQPAPDSGYEQPAPQPSYGYPAPDSGYTQPTPQPEYGYAYPEPPQPMPAYPVYPQPAPAVPYAYAAPAPGYYVPQTAPAAPQMPSVPGSSESIILIYKDGRPPEQIQNYLATRTTLTILDGGRRRVVPLSELNLPATVSANRQTGVDFRLPTAKP